MMRDLDTKKFKKDQRFKKLLRNYLLLIAQLFTKNTLIEKQAHVVAWQNKQHQILAG